LFYTVCSVRYCTHGRRVEKRNQWIHCWSERNDDLWVRRQYKWRNVSIGRTVDIFCTN